MSAAVASRIAAALPPENISYEVTLLEDDGKETGIRGRSMTFASLFIEQAQEFKFIPVASAVIGGLLTTLLVTRNASASAASGAIGLIVLSIYVATSSFLRSRKLTPAISWKFEGEVPL